MKPLRQRLLENWGRITAAAAVMGAELSLLWPSSNWRPDGEPTVVLLGALGVWLYMELVHEEAKQPNTVPAPLVRMRHPHDLELWALFNQHFPLQDRCFCEITTSVQTPTLNA